MYGLFFFVHRIFAALMTSKNLRYAIGWIKSSRACSSAESSFPKSGAILLTLAGKMDLFDRLLLRFSFSRYLCRAISVLRAHSTASLKPGIPLAATAASIATRSRDFSGRLESSPGCSLFSCRSSEGNSPNSRPTSSNFAIVSTRVLRTDPLSTPVLSSKNLIYNLASRSATVSLSYPGAVSSSSSLNSMLNLAFRSSRVSCLARYRSIVRSDTPNTLADVLVESWLVSVAANSFLADCLSPRKIFRLFSCNLAISSTLAVVVGLVSKGAPANAFRTTLIFAAATSFDCASLSFNLAALSSSTSSFSFSSSRLLSYLRTFDFFGLPGRRRFEGDNARFCFLRSRSCIPLSSNLTAFAPLLRGSFSCSEPSADNSVCDSISVWSLDDASCDVDSPNWRWRCTIDA